ncbi:MAG: hypothetical protein EP333_07740 [Bacteroidetes bacterium]|nr:MAG: hypothetical protein EP333_07740 [Bacteroidota bacterium]TNE95788.1 MAG: hypothetical protein EP322_09385 [Bacteroidota bacterium]
MTKFFHLHVLLLSVFSFGQESDLIDAHREDSELKIVIRTEEQLEDRYVAMDNMTIKIYGDTTKVYYINYSDGMVGSMMIPYSVFDRFVKYEAALKTYDCATDPCKNSVLIEIGEEAKRYPIDLFHVESLSSLMLELEN